MVGQFGEDFMTAQDVVIYSTGKDGHIFYMRTCSGNWRLRDGEGMATPDLLGPQELMSERTHSQIMDLCEDSKQGLYNKVLWFYMERND